MLQWITKYDCFSDLSSQLTFAYIWTEKLKQIATDSEIWLFRSGRTVFPIESALKFVSIVFFRGNVIWQDCRSASSMDALWLRAKRLLARIVHRLNTAVPPFFVWLWKQKMHLQLWMGCETGLMSKQECDVVITKVVLQCQLTYVETSL